MSTENVKKRSSSAALLKTVPSRICDKYDKIYENGPTTKRVVYIKKKHDGTHGSPYDTTSISPSISGFLNDCTEAVCIDSNEQRQLGGKQPTQIVNIMPSLTVCNIKSKKPKKAVESSSGVLQPNIVHVQIKDTPYNPNWERFNKCLILTDKKPPCKISRGTQTLYRESSAQTLPYLPGVSNDKKSLETLELFKLPKILKGDGPPGLYEVEILERARKRWAFEKAIKQEFECKMKEARSELARKKHFLKHKHVIEAFEWEHWLQREEAIQSYQMMRFDLVIRIFEKREREMHQKSNLRITICCEQIAAKRDKALKKNEIEYGRQMRRMKIEHERKPRNWRKEKISDQLGDPSSEYYGPQMRYGVNPNRRHFQLSRKAFEMRMEDLEKRAVNMKNLECPFAKLKEWSKPKVLKPEIEQNFCTDTNLKKLYESLKGLREHSKKQKIVPKCLKEKVKEIKPIPASPVVDDEFMTEEFEYMFEEESSIEKSDEGVQVGVSFSQNSLIEMYSQRNSNILSLEELLNERRREELEVLLAEYEGTKIGWLMRFLSEEMGRLQEQRKLHFITMLAQKERWRREAAEAGLRQKENEMRRIYEEIFDETDKANVDVCEQYLDNIFGIDTREQADFEAAQSITGLAKVIDADLQRWISSFKLIQHPLNYDDLRCLLRDLVFPENLVECLVRQYEATSVVDYIINDVLFPHIYTLLEPIDVVSPLTNNMIDRLIDNDLYLFSSECSSSCDCYDFCECTTPELEAKAIIRKLIRQAVPGRRWRTPTERIAVENVNDIIDMVCGKTEDYKSCTFTPRSPARRPTVKKIPSAIDLFGPKMDSNMAFEMQRTSADTSAQSSRLDMVTIVQYRKVRTKRESTTRSLPRKRDDIRTTDTMVSSGSVLLGSSNLNRNSSTDEYRPSSLRKIPSTLDVLNAMDGGDVPDGYESTNSSDEEIEQITRTHKHERRASQSFIRAICNDIVENILPPLDIYGDADVDSSETQQTDSDKGPDLTLLDELAVQLMVEDSEGLTASEIETERTSKFEGYESYDHNIDTEAGKTTSEHTMYFSDRHLKEILKDDGECKCQMELDYRNNIKELYESGKIKIIYSEPRSVEDSEDQLAEIETVNFEFSEMGFEEGTIHYDTTADQSNYLRSITDGEGYEDEEFTDVAVDKDSDRKKETEADTTIDGEKAIKTDEQAEVLATEEEFVEKTDAPVAHTEPTAEFVEEQTVVTEPAEATEAIADASEAVDQAVTEEIAITAEAVDQPAIADDTTAAAGSETQEEADTAAAADATIETDSPGQPPENLDEANPVAENQAPAEE